MHVICRDCMLSGRERGSSLKILMLPFSGHLKMFFPQEWHSNTHPQNPRHRDNSHMTGNMQISTLHLIVLWEINLNSIIKIFKYFKLLVSSACLLGLIYWPITQPGKLSQPQINHLKWFQIVFGAGWVQSCHSSLVGSFTRSVIMCCVIEEISQWRPIGGCSPTHYQMLGGHCCSHTHTHTHTHTREINSQENRK
jgi:hypothetical protein